jgi:DNA-binding ferritin-like protein
MPIRHTDNGWYWGSKGPFDTKAKALAVARAAHASGYREQQGGDMNHDAVKSLVSCLMGAIVSARIIHWNTKSYAEHKALGKFYSGLEEMTDSYVEAYMGVYGRMGSFDLVVEHEDTTGVELVNDVSDFIQSLRAELPNDTQLQNLLDEIAALADKTAYLLTLE